MHPVDLKSFIERLSHLSGEVILPFFRAHFPVFDKGHGSFDPVTEADRAAESVIRRHIHSTFPSHGIIGEEFGDENIDAEYVWMIDPIDGTRAFICGLTNWGTLIGLTRNGNPVMGSMNQPYIGEYFWGDGKQAVLKTKNGIKELSSSNCTSIEEARLMTTDPRLFSSNEARSYSFIEQKVKIARYGADCYAYAMLAAGFVDVVIESGLKPHDISALIPIIEGAGGIITTWDGKSARNGGRIIAAANKKLHECTIELINKSAANDDISSA